MTEIDLSVVIPLFNEEENINPLHQELTAALERLDLAYEIIIVDDGSTDRSFQLLRALQAEDDRLTVTRFRRNFGQTAAFAAGFDRARGHAVVTLDADLQNDPADIPLLLDKLDEGYDVVSGWRMHRKDPFVTRRLPSIVANAMISWSTGVHLHDYGCSLKVYRCEVVKNLQLYGELHRFIPALASWMGVEVAEVPVNHRARLHGSSKYGLSRILRVLLDLLTVRFLLSYATRPIQIFGLVGLLAFAVGSLLTLYLGIVRLFLRQPISGRPLLLLAILLTLIGVQFITMGLLGELMVRTYHESQRKPIYMVREVLEAEDPAPHEDALGRQTRADLLDAKR